MVQTQLVNSVTWYPQVASYPSDASAPLMRQESREPFWGVCAVRPCLIRVFNVVVIDWIMAPKETYVLIPELRMLPYIHFVKRHFVNMISLRIFEMRRLSWSNQLALHAIKSVLLSRGQREIGHRRLKVMWWWKRREIWRCCTTGFEDGQTGSNLKRGNPEAEKTREMGSSPEPLEGAQPADILVWAQWHVFRLWRLGL